MTEQLLAIDLFCGAGGMSLGFEQAGFTVVGAVDVDPIHVQTHEKNFPGCKTIAEDIALVSGVDLTRNLKLEGKRVHALFGGAPCQGFSLIGKRQGDDPRNALVHQFARLVAEVRPMYFVLENVEGLLSRQTRPILDRFIEEVGKAEYDVVEPVQVLDASQFGVPQRRRRVFVLGCQRGLPKPAYPVGSLSSPPTVRDAIGDLSGIVGKGLFESDEYTGRLDEPSHYAAVLRGEVSDPDDQSAREKRTASPLIGCRKSRHKAETIARFKATVPGTADTVSRLYRLAWQGQAPTLRAGTDSAHGSYTAPRPIHPAHPRCITVREAARLHSFPDWFQFHETVWHGFRQIGNSVPPLLARAVAKCVRDAAEACEGEGL